MSSIGESSKCVVPSDHGVLSLNMAVKLQSEADLLSAKLQN